MAEYLLLLFPKNRYSLMSKILIYSAVTYVEFLKHVSVRHESVTYTFCFKDFCVRMLKLLMKNIIYFRLELG